MFRGRRVAAWAWIALASACGGDPPREPKTPADADDTDDEPSGDFFADDPSETRPDEDSVEARCADGTCSPCGDALCPTGYYCDESAEPAICSWLPECAREPSCECIAEVLGSECRCEARDGGVYVTCS